MQTPLLLLKSKSSREGDNKMGAGHVQRVTHNRNKELGRGRPMNGIQGSARTVASTKLKKIRSAYDSVICHFRKSVDYFFLLFGGKDKRWFINFPNF